MEWVAEMKIRGMFASDEGPPPKSNDLSLFLKQATVAKENDLKDKKLKKKLTSITNKKAEYFLADCHCFLGEMKSCMHTLSSVQQESTQPVPSPRTRTGQNNDKAASLKEQEYTLSSPPPYSEVCTSLDTVPHLMPQHTSPVLQITTLQDTPGSGHRHQPTAGQCPVATGEPGVSPEPATDSLLVVRSNLMISASFPGNADSQEEAAMYLDTVARRTIPEGSIGVNPQYNQAATHSAEAVRDIKERMEKGSDWLCYSDSLAHAAHSRPPVTGNIDGRARPHYHMPLVTSVPRGGSSMVASNKYIPYCLQDAVMLKSGMPDINQGGSPWIKAFIGNMDGMQLTLGDFRRVFTACTSLALLKVVETTAHTSLYGDDLPLTRVVDSLWPVLRVRYPVQTTELHRVPPKKGETGAQYLQRARDLWLDMIGEDPLGSPSLELLFKGAVEAAMSPHVQGQMKQVVGRIHMTYGTWAAHVEVYMDNELAQTEQKEKERKANEAIIARAQVKGLRDKANTAKKLAEQMHQVTPQVIPQPMQQPAPFHTPLPIDQWGPQVEQYCPFQHSGRGRRARQKRNDTCYACGNYGHWARQCPYRQ